MRRSETWTPTWSTTGRSWTPPRGCCSRWELPSGSTRLIGAGAGCETTNYASGRCFKNSWLPPQELLNRSALETQKLELLTEVSSLKLKLAAVDRDHRDGEVTLTPPPLRPPSTPFSLPPASSCVVRLVPGSRSLFVLESRRVRLTPAESSRNQKKLKEPPGFQQLLPACREPSGSRNTINIGHQYRRYREQILDLGVIIQPSLSIFVKKK